MVKKYHISAPISHHTLIGWLYIITRSQFWKQGLHWTLLRIKKTQTTPLHPQSDERLNETLESQLFKVYQVQQASAWLGSLCLLTLSTQPSTRVPGPPLQCCSWDESYDYQLTCLDVSRPEEHIPAHDSNEKLQMTLEKSQLHLTAVLVWTDGDVLRLQTHADIKSLHCDFACRLPVCHCLYNNPICLFVHVSSRPSPPYILKPNLSVLLYIPVSNSTWEPWELPL